MSSRDTICAVATPPGQGAVALVRLSGPRALEILRALSGREHFEARRATLVTLRASPRDAPIDRALAVFFAAPRSYTGEDVVELSCHGNPLVAEAVLAAALAHGARRAEPGEYTRRAFLEGKLDLTQAEAVAAVVGARGQRALDNAQALLGGVLGQRVRALREGVLGLAADLEACIDFSDDVQAPVPTDLLGAAFDGLAHEVDRLAQTYAAGQRLGGISIALAGPVNVGKSSLFNALLGSRRALVSDEAGTTRDYIEAELVWDGVVVTLVDTAGSRPRERMSPLEAQGHALGAERLGRCDLVVDLVDLNDLERISGEVDLAKSRAVIGTKLDLVPAEARADVVQRVHELAGPRAQVVVLSVPEADAAQLDALRKTLAKAVFGPRDLVSEAETVQVAERRQHDALRRAQQALLAGNKALLDGLAPELVVEHCREALSALGSVTGEEFTEALLDHVFSRFCIGK